MATDPLAISTGQGMGEAQVLNQNQNSYYKDKANLGLKRRAETQKGLEESSANELWVARDGADYNKKLAELRQYTADNQRLIRSGDFTAQSEFNAKKNELKQLALNSMQDKNAWSIGNKMIEANPDKFSDETKQRYADYAKSSFKNDPDALRMDLRFDNEWLNNNIIKDVNALGYDPSTIKIKKVVGDGGIEKNVLISGSQQFGDLESMADKWLLESESKFGSKQTAENVTKEDIVKLMRSQLDRKQSASQISEPSSYSPGSNDNYGWDLNKSNIPSYVPTRTEGTAGVGVGVKLGKGETVQAGNLQLPTKVRTQFNLNSNVIPMGGYFKDSEGEEVEITADMDWTPDLAKSFKEYAPQIRDLDIGSVKVIPVFPKGTKSRKKSLIDKTEIKEEDRVDLSGQPVPASFFNEDGTVKAEYEKDFPGIRFQGMAAVQGADNFSGLVPIASVQNSMYNYKPWKEGAEQEMKKLVKERNRLLKKGVSSENNPQPENPETIVPGSKGILYEDQ